MSNEALIGELAGCRTDLRAVAHRQNWMIVVGAAGVVLLLVAIVLGTVATVRFQAADTKIQTKILENNQLLCPTIRQLASTDPPRSTKAGQRQVEEFRKIMRSPQYNC